jgi:hypothetical protein
MTYQNEERGGGRRQRRYFPVVNNPNNKFKHLIVDKLDLPVGFIKLIALSK